MVSLLPVLWFCGLFSVTAAVDCPSGWLIHGQICYHFSHDQEEWRLARMICQDFGADLAEVLTRDVDLFLQQEVERLKGHFWLGGNDLEEEGIWKWASSGMKIADYFAHWDTNEPSNGSPSENCMEIRFGRTGWNDLQCKSYANYICAKEPGVEPEVIG